MKRLARVSIKLAAAPAVALIQVLLLLTCACFAVWEYLNDSKEPVYSYTDLLQDYTGQFLKHWRTILL